MGSVLQSEGVGGLLMWLAVMATLSSKSSQTAVIPSHSAKTHTHKLYLSLPPSLSGGGAQCSSGVLRVRGIKTDDLVAGRLEFCHEMEWKAVCDNKWDAVDATTVCTHFGLSQGEWKISTPTTQWLRWLCRLPLQRIMLWHKCFS